MAASGEELVPKKDTVSAVIWNWFAFAKSDLDQTRKKMTLAAFFKKNAPVSSPNQSEAE